MVLGSAVQPVLVPCDDNHTRLGADNAFDDDTAGPEPGFGSPPEPGAGAARLIREDFATTSTRTGARSPSLRPHAQSGRRPRSGDTTAVVPASQRGVTVAQEDLWEVVLAWTPAHLQPEVFALVDPYRVTDLYERNSSV